MTDEAVEIRGEIRFCTFCLNKECLGFWFINGKNEKDRPLTFMYMKENEASHIECYIKECVRRSLNDFSNMIPLKDSQTQPEAKE